MKTLERLQTIGVRKTEVEDDHVDGAGFDAIARVIDRRDMRDEDIGEALVQQFPQHAGVASIVIDDEQARRR